MRQFTLLRLRVATVRIAGWLEKCGGPRKESSLICRNLVDIRNGGHENNKSLQLRQRTTEDSMMSRYLLSGLTLIACSCVASVFLLEPAAAQPPGGYNEEIKKRTAEWEDPKNPRNPFAFVPLLTGTPSGKAISLHFGLNQVDPAAYPGTPELEACEEDAKAMEKLVHLKFETKIILSRDATSARLFAEIDAAAKALNAGDILLITYSGHGGERLDTSPNPEELYDQTLCLYDRQVIDDELYEKWATFNKDVRIILIADSCHSGTVARMALAAKAPATRVTPRGFENQGSSFAKMKSQARDLANGIPLAAGVKSAYRTLGPIAQRDANARQKNVLDGFKQKVAKQSRSVSDLKCSVLLLAACQDNQLAGEVGDHGLFTAAILSLVNRPDLDTYRKLLDSTVQFLQDVPNQRPSLFLLGPDADKIAALKPFSR
jgi:hypothetical protein